MSLKSAISLAISLVAAVLLLGGIYRLGYQHGEASATARCESARVATLQEAMAASTALAHQANRASAALRDSTAEWQRHSQQTTEDLRHVLDATAAARAECRFNAGIMRQLTTAREHAAKAVTGGLPAVVPTAGGGQ